MTVVSPGAARTRCHRTIRSTARNPSALSNPASWRARAWLTWRSADSVPLRGVDPLRHQFEVGDDVVELRGNRAWDDVVHAELVPGVRAALDRRGLALAHFGQTVGVQATQLLCDVEVAPERFLGQPGRLGLHLPGQRLVEQGSGVPSTRLGDGEPMHGLLHSRVGSPLAQGRELGRVQQGAQPADVHLGAGQRKCQQRKQGDPEGSHDGVTLPDLYAGASHSRAYP